MPTKLFIPRDNPVFIKTRTEIAALTPIDPPPNTVVASASTNLSTEMEGKVQKLVVENTA